MKSRHFYCMKCQLQVFPVALNNFFYTKLLTSVTGTLTVAECKSKLIYEWVSWETRNIFLWFNSFGNNLVSKLFKYWREYNSYNLFFGSIQTWATVDFRECVSWTSCTKKKMNRFFFQFKQYSTGFYCFEFTLRFGYEIILVTN